MFIHPPPQYALVQSRTDVNIDDEAAGEARKEYAAESLRRRKEEAARVKAANQVMKARLKNIKAKTDDGDGQIGGPPSPWISERNADRDAQAAGGHRDELGAVRDSIFSAYQVRVQAENKEHKHKVSSMRPTVNDDHQTPAVAAERSRLRRQAMMRKQAEWVALRQKNAAYFRKIGAAQTVTDTKIWDDGEGSAGEMRVVVRRRSFERKATEAKALAAENAAFKAKLATVQAKTDDGDGLQF